MLVDLLSVLRPCILNFVWVVGLLGCWVVGLWCCGVGLVTKPFITVLFILDSVTMGRHLCWRP